MRDPGKINFNVDENDILKCLELFLMIQNEDLPLTNKKVHRLANKIDITKYSTFGNIRFGPDNL